MLTAARDLLINGGICRRAYSNGSGAHCVAGAILAAPRRYKRHDVQLALVALRSHVEREHAMTIEQFNDTHSDDEIIALLNTVIRGVTKS